MRDGLIATGCGDSCFLFVILQNYWIGRLAGCQVDLDSSMTESRPEVEIGGVVHQANSGGRNLAARSREGWSHQLVAYRCVDRLALQDATDPARR